MSKKIDKTAKAIGRKVSGEANNNRLKDDGLPKAQLVPKGLGHVIHVHNPTDGVCVAAIRSGHRVSTLPKENNVSPDIKEIHPHSGPFPSRTKAKTAARSLDLEIE